jgi:hypothetical protein
MGFSPGNAIWIEDLWKISGPGDARWGFRASIERTQSEKACRNGVPIWEQVEIGACALNRAAETPSLRNSPEVVSEPLESAAEGMHGLRVEEHGHCGAISDVEWLTDGPDFFLQMLLDIAAWISPE